MLACGHDREPFGVPVCSHLRTCREGSLTYLRWYTGAGMANELLCGACVRDRESGRLVTAAFVCRECFDFATTEVGDLEGIHGKPEIRIRSEPIDPRLRSTCIPKEIGRIVDIAAVDAESRSIWLMLAEDGTISRFDAERGERKRLAQTSVAAEPDRKPWCGHVSKRRLHASPGGDFAAVVNDYGRHGEIIDLRTGRAALALDGGDYHAETIPFSFGFATVAGRLVAIHRTDWNRLDVSDPFTGQSMTPRSPTRYQRGEERPAHHLDYFHGSLRPSPNGIRIADDGWVWSPVGVPATWELEPWISGNPWESEDGPTRKSLCARAYYWDHAMAWLDDHRIAVGGIGDDDNEMIEGVRVFDVTTPGSGGVRWRADWPWPREIATFAGPSGSFFSEGRALFSSDPSGFSRWDVADGVRTGYLPDFRPTHHHRGAREFAQVIDDVLVGWTIDNGTS